MPALPPGPERERSHPAPRPDTARRAPVVRRVRGHSQPLTCGSLLSGRASPAKETHTSALRDAHQAAERRPVLLLLVPRRRPARTVAAPALHLDAEHATEPPLACLRFGRPTGVFSFGRHALACPGGAKAGRGRPRDACASSNSAVSVASRGPDAIRAAQLDRTASDSVACRVGSG